MAYVALPPQTAAQPERHVTIGIRLRSPIGWNHAWISLLNMDKTIAGNLIPAEGYGAAESARFIFRKFLNETKDTHLLMLDDDCVVSEQTLNRLYSRHLPVVGALTWTNGFPPMPTIWRGYSGVDKNYPSFWVRQDDVAKWFEDPRTSPELNQLKDSSSFVLSCTDDDLIKRTDAIGLHCVLIQREVLLGIGEPYLMPDEVGVREDFDFSQRAGRLGVDLYVDTSVVVGHIRAHSIRPLDYYVWETFKESQKKAT